MIKILTGIGETKMMVKTSGIYGQFAVTEFTIEPQGKRIGWTVSHISTGFRLAGCLKRNEARFVARFLNVESNIVSFNIGETREQAKEWAKTGEAKRFIFSRDCLINSYNRRGEK